MKARAADRAAGRAATARRDAGLLARALRLTVSAAPGPAAALAVVTTLGALAPTATVWLTKVVVDRLAAGAGATGPAVLYGAVLGALAVLRPLERMLAAEIEERAVGEVDRRLMDAGTRLVDLHRIERPAFHDELEALRMAVNYTPRTVHLADRALQVPLSLLTVLALLVPIHPLLPVVLGVVVIVHILSMGRMGRLRHKTMFRHSRTGREMDYCAEIATEAAGAKEVRVFGLGDYFLGLFRRRAALAVADIRSARVKQLRATFLIAILHGAVLAAGFVYIARRVSTGGLTPGDVALYLGAVVQAEMVAWGLSFLFTMGQETVLNLRIVFPFLDSAGPAIAVARPEKAVAAPVTIRAGVAFDRVSFRYPESDRPVLDGLNGVLPGGRVTAVVGANGAGKSTLVKLLTRMYDPDGGAIVVDGRALAEIDLASWRASLSAVYQDFARFALTVRENISLAGPDGAVDIERAAAWAGVMEVADRLPKGLGTQLTRRFADGSELSGGEWQKVALA
ncbi:MAG: ATP-binding cassette domain-containing protein, partial [Acidimicrobiales bacterium]